MTTKIYVEGGGKGDALRGPCRKAFHSLLASAGIKNHPRIISSGGRTEAYSDFCTALRNAAEDDRIMLLVDSEEPVNTEPWEHLGAQDGWEPPDGATNDDAYLMVQCMETWFLTDRPLLKRFFGEGYLDNALPRNPKLEDIPKDDVLNGLANATRGCGHVREYRKGKRSFDILGQLDPVKLGARCPSAQRLFDALTGCD